MTNGNVLHLSLTEGVRQMQGINTNALKPCPRRAGATDLYHTTPRMCNANIKLTTEVGFGEEVYKATNNTNLVN